MKMGLGGSVGWGYCSRKKIISSILTELINSGKKINISNILFKIV